MTELTLPEIQNERDYVNFVNKRASEITTVLMNEELDDKEDEELVEYIETDESLQEVIKSLDEEWSNYHISDVARVYEIVVNNYPVTVDYVKDREEMYDGNNPVTKFREFALACVAYDISKTVDQQIENTIDEDL